MENQTATPTGASIETRIENFLLNQDKGAETPPDPEKAVQDVKAETPEIEEKANEPDVASEDAEEKEGRKLSVDDIALALGIEADKFDVDDDGNLFVKTKVDGIEGKAKPADLLKSYQLEGHLNKKNMEVAEQQKALQTKLAEVEEQSKQRLEQLDTYLNLTQNKLNHEYSSINWAELRATDPGEFSAKLSEFQIRQAQLKEAVDYVDQQRKQKIIESQSKELEKLKSAIPEWSDTAVAEKERIELKNYLHAKSINPAVADYADGVVLLRKAMLFDKLQAAKTDTVKQVRVAPKFVKAGQVESGSDRAANDKNAAKKAYKDGKSTLAEYLLKTNRV